MNKRNLKNSGILSLVVVGILLMLIGCVNAYSGGGGTCSCGDGSTTLGGNSTDACADCSAALNDNINCANQVNYVGTVAITNYVGTCINNPKNFNNKIFDCQGHKIDGDDNGNDYGIYLYKKSGNIIKNCVINDFAHGIFMDSSSNTQLLNNNISKVNSTIWSYGIYSFNQNNISIKNCNVENYDYGIYLFLTSNSTISGNTIKSNMYGIYTDSIHAEELNFLNIINEYRRNNSISTLSLSVSLMRAARGHSQDMANHNYYAHNSSDGRTVKDRIRDAGYDLTPPCSISENIAAGYPDAASVFVGWKNSYRHNENMLNANFKVIGIGLAYNSNSYYKTYWTTDFGNRNDTLNNPFLSYISQNNKIENNIACSNAKDFYFYNCQSCSGDNNTCDNADGWDDMEITGCTCNCSATSTPSCIEFDFDDNGAIDIFDIVAGLEHLSSGNPVPNEGCTAKYNNEIDIFDLLTLIDKIVIES